MPAVVAAAGAGLGAWAGGALMKNFGPKADAPVQIDPSESIMMFSQATSANNYYDQLGLGSYENQLNQARDEIQQNYGNALSTLQPSSQAGSAALNEMMRFMGLDPIQATANIGTQLAAIPGIGDTSQIQVLIDQANNEKDPTIRAQLKDQLTSALQNAPINDPTQADIAALGGMPTYAYAGVKNAYGPNDKDAKGNSLNGKPIVDAGPQPTSRQLAPDGSQQMEVDEGARQDMINQANSTYQDQLYDWKAQVARTTAADQARVQAAQSSRNLLAEQFNNDYTANYDAAYTGDQVAQKLQATPGYDFTLKQGSQSVERAGAAAGMLGSGNTLAALQNYGQGLAMQYFNTHMQNLASIAGIGESATNNIATAQENLGGSLAQLDTLKAGAEQNTYNNIGAITSQNMSSAAQVAYEADQFNSNILEQNAKMNAQIQQQAIASGPAYMGAQLNQAMFNYQVAQNQQGGQAYLSGNNQAQSNTGASV